MTDQKLTEELYGVGCRKGSDLASYHQHAFSAEAYADGTHAGHRGRPTACRPLWWSRPLPSSPPLRSDSDVAYIQGKGTLVIGITEFEPMDYQDAERRAGSALMPTWPSSWRKSWASRHEFMVIDWDNKVFELDGKTIDVVWNGMTLTDAVQEAMECTNAYCNNAQVVVTK